MGLDAYLRFLISSTPKSSLASRSLHSHSHFASFWSWFSAASGDNNHVSVDSAACGVKDESSSGCDVPIPHFQRLGSVTIDIWIMIGFFSTKAESWHLKLAQNTRGDTDIRFDVHPGDIFIRRWPFLHIYGFKTRPQSEVVPSLESNARGWTMYFEDGYVMVT